MARVQIICPECSAPLRLSDEVIDRKKVRCPKCETVFRPSEDNLDQSDSALLRRRAERSHSSSRRSDAPDRPGPSRSKHKSQKSSASLVVATAVIGLLVLGGVAALAAVYWPEKKPNQPAVAAANNDGTPRLPAPPMPAKAGGTGTEIGQTALEIDGEDIDGKRFKLSDYRGKVVVLDFWGDW